MSDRGAAEPRLHRVLDLLDMEAASVVSILLGLFQLLLSAPLFYADVGLLKNLFIVPLVTGILILVAGSFGIANVRSPSRHLRQGYAYSNVAGLLGAVLALCLYGVAVRSPKEVVCPDEHHGYYYPYESEICLERRLAEMFTGLTTLLLCYNAGALLLHGLLTVTSIRALRSP